MIPHGPFLAALINAFALCFRCLRHAPRKLCALRPSYLDAVHQDEEAPAELGWAGKIPEIAILLRGCDAARAELPAPLCIRTMPPAPSEKPGFLGATGVDPYQNDATVNELAFQHLEMRDIP